MTTASNIGANSGLANLQAQVAAQDSVINRKGPPTDYEKVGKLAEDFEALFLGSILS